MWIKTVQQASVDVAVNTHYFRESTRQFAAIDLRQLNIVDSFIFNDGRVNGDRLVLKTPMAAYKCFDCK